MNAASQNLEHHFGVLREKLSHPTDYELALYYFLEEFAADAGFLEQSQPEEAPHLMGVLTHVAGKALGHAATLDRARLLRLPRFGFFHGNAATAGRVVLFFYFEDIDTGLMALIPGIHGAAEIARFRLKDGLLDPRNN